MWGGLGMKMAAAATLEIFSGLNDLFPRKSMLSPISITIHACAKTYKKQTKSYFKILKLKTYHYVIPHFVVAKTYSYI